MQTIYGDPGIYGPLADIWHTQSRYLLLIDAITTSIHSQPAPGRYSNKKLMDRASVVQRQRVVNVMRHLGHGLLIVHGKWRDKEQ